MLKQIICFLLLTVTIARSDLYKYTDIYSGTNPVEFVYKNGIVWERLYALEFNGSTDYVDTGVYMEANKHLEMRMFYHMGVWTRVLTGILYYRAHGFAYGFQPRFLLGFNTASVTNRVYGYGNVLSSTVPDTGEYSRWRGAVLTCTNFIENGAVIVSYNAPTNSASSGIYSVHIGCIAYSSGTTERFPVTVHRWQILKNGVVVQDCKANKAGSFTDLISGTNIVGKNGAMQVISISTNQPSLWAE